MRIHGTNSDGEPLSSMYVERLGDNPSFAIDFTDHPSLTRTEFAEECDINVLMARYEKTGILPTNMNGNVPQFLDVTEIPDYRTTLDMLNDASAAFMALPATVRREFDNDPLQFVEFARDPENLPQMRTWGLAPPEAAPPEPMRVEVVNPAPPPPEPATGS